jgi:hypothetical protein
MQGDAHRRGGGGRWDAQELQRDRDDERDDGEDQRGPQQPARAVREVLAVAAAFAEHRTPARGARVPAREEEDRRQLGQPGHRPQPGLVGTCPAGQRHRGLAQHQQHDARHAEDGPAVDEPRCPRGPLGASPGTRCRAADVQPATHAEHQQAGDHHDTGEHRAERVADGRAPALVPGVDDQAGGVEGGDGLAGPGGAVRVEHAHRVHVRREPVVERAAVLGGERVALARRVPEQVVAEVVGLAGDGKVPFGVVVAPGRRAAAVGVHRADGAVARGQRPRADAGQRGEVGRELGERGGGRAGMDEGFDGALRGRDVALRRAGVRRFRSPRGHEAEPEDDQRQDQKPARGRQRAPHTPDFGRGCGVLGWNGHGPRVSARLFGEHPDNPRFRIGSARERRRPASRIGLAREPCGAGDIRFGVIAERVHYSSGESNGYPASSPIVPAEASIGLWTATPSAGNFRSDQGSSRTREAHSSPHRTVHCVGDRPANPKSGAHTRRGVTFPPRA